MRAFTDSALQHDESDLDTDAIKAVLDAAAQAGNLSESRSEAEISIREGDDLKAISQESKADAEALRDIVGNKEILTFLDNLEKTNDQSDKTVSIARRGAFLREVVEEHPESNATERRMSAIREPTSLDDLATLARMLPEVEVLDAAGTWDGVFVRCLLHMFGVTLFLRVGWMVGEIGLAYGIVIIVLASFIEFLTALSVSALSTNGAIQQEGAYFMISRAIGPQVGAAVGCFLALSNMAATAMYVLGFAETLQGQLAPSTLTGDPTNDIRVYGVILCILLTGMAFFAANVNTSYNRCKHHVKMFVLIIISVAIIVFIVGTFLSHPVATGVEAYSPEQLKANMGHGDKTAADFFRVFAVFFPALTGIMAGANMCKHLKNPTEAIPVGTLSAVFSSTLLYLIVAIMLGATCQRIALVTNLTIMATADRKSVV